MRHPWPYADSEVNPAHDTNPDRTTPMTMTFTTEIATVGRRFDVVGMTCSHCEHAIETEVGAIPGVCMVTADAASGTVTVERTQVLEVADVAAAVDEAGYELAR